MKIKFLINSEAALAKLFIYGFLPARQHYYLATMRRQMIECIESFYATRQTLFERYGKLSESGSEYAVPRGGEEEKAFLAELIELENQDSGFDLDESKMALCIESIDRIEKDLPQEKRLGFSANDWLAIRDIIKVTETEG